MKQGFINKLQSILDLNENMSLQAFIGLKTNGQVIVKKANFKTEVITLLSDGFKASIRSELEEFNNDDERDVLHLSTIDERSNVVYKYDLPDEEPSYFSTMREVAQIHPINYWTNDKMFNFDNDNLSDIQYFIYKIGVEDNFIVAYRTSYNFNVLHRGRGRFYVNKSGTQFANIEGDILKLDCQIDTILGDNDSFFLTNLKSLERSSDFAGIIKRRATQSIAELERIELLHDIDVLRDRIDELPFARRLMRSIDSSPVLHMNKSDVLTFVRGHETLSRILTISDEKIIASSKKSQDALIRLLNDDFLHSQLTSLNYKTTSKDRL